VKDLKRDLEKILERVSFRRSELDRRTKLNLQTEGLKWELIERSKKLGEIVDGLKKMIEEI
tara:strand:- start:1360 stop:1542 length:183 start_codon:yes stop_codon:yes gene_type:complete